MSEWINFHYWVTEFHNRLIRCTLTGCDNIYIKTLIKMCGKPDLDKIREAVIDVYIDEVDVEYMTKLFGDGDSFTLRHFKLIQDIPKHEFMKSALMDIKSNLRNILNFIPDDPEFIDGDTILYNNKYYPKDKLIEGLIDFDISGNIGITDNQYTLIDGDRCIFKQTHIEMIETNIPIGQWIVDNIQVDELYCEMDLITDRYVKIDNHYEFII